MPTPAAPTLPGSEVVWFDDDVPAGMYDPGWTTAQQASGTRSVHVPSATGLHETHSYGATTPLALITHDRVSFYLLLNPCDMPREVQVFWYDPPVGWKGLYWGEDLIGGESSMVDMGAVPDGGEWHRFEVPALQLGIENRNVGGFKIRLYDGEAWVDRFARVPPSCILPPVAAPTLANDEIPWLDDEVAPGMYAPLWSTAQKASGTRSVWVPHGNGLQQMHSFGADPQLDVETGDELSFYLLLNECAMPRQVQVQWYDPAVGWKGVYWGESLIGGESGLSNQGAIPDGGEWHRFQFSAYALGLENRGVGGFKIMIYDGEAWIDRFSIVKADCLIERLPSVHPSVIPSSERAWIDDQVALGMYSPLWSTRQKASGTRSIWLPHGEGLQQTHSYGATIPLVPQAGESLSFYVLLNPCATPRELQVQWYDPPVGWKGAWWGESLIGGESGLHGMGALPTAGGWVRIEIPAATLNLAGRSIGGFLVKIYDGEAWIDRFGLVTSSSTEHVLSGIAADPSSLTMEVDDEAQLTMTASYSDGTTLDVTPHMSWSSGDTGVATVTAGHVTAVALGGSTITATLGSETVLVDVIVESTTPPTCPMPEIEPPSLSEEELPWIDDEILDGMYEPVWSTLQKASGERSIWVQPGAGVQQIHSFGATTMLDVETGDELSFYLLLNECAKPREVQVLWYDPAVGWKGVYWGETLIGGETPLKRLGPVPSGGVWRRFQVPAYPLGLENRAIGGFKIMIYDGEAWVDRFSIVKAECSIEPLPSAHPSAIPSNERPWVDDEVPAGMYSPLWSTSQKASGTRSIWVPHGEGLQQMHSFGATTPIVPQADESLSFYILINPCAIPRELQVEWYDPPVGWKGAWWGDDWLLGRENVLLSMGDLPDAGEWVRIEIPASSLNLVGRPVGGFMIKIYDGEAWIDRFGLVTSSTERELVSLEVDPATLTMDPAGTAQVTATASYSDGTTLDVTPHLSWSSSNSGVATVAAGLITAVAGGFATITGTLGSDSVTVSVGVSGAPAMLAILPDTMTIDHGAVAYLMAEREQGGNYTDVTAEATWSSSDSSIVSVDASGAITGVSPGIATITAEHDSLTATAEITVVPVVESAVVTPDGAVLVIDGTQQFQFVHTYRDGDTTNASATWSSNDEAVATVDASGLVTAHAAGIAVITAESTDPARTATAAVTVLPPVESLAVTPTPAHLTVGASRRLAAIGTVSGGATHDITHLVTWSSTNDAIVSVDTRGRITAHAAGSTSITATLGSVSGNATLVAEAAILNPPDPETVAPEIDPTIVTTVHDSTKFLYEGPDRLQTGVDPGAITRERASVLRGRVLARGGAPLAEVRITIVDHPELGQTYSRADGRFDLAANGGGELVLRYEKDGYTTLDRSAAPSWNDWEELEDAVLVAYDTAVTSLDLTEPGMKVARATVVSDEEGSRRATMVFRPGTTATMTLPDGTTQTLAEINVRATEYTVGADGPSAMPAPLPPQTAYTYCVELSVDEAVAAGAETVEFSQPVGFYVENYLEFPVGSIVPAGYYDRVKAAWIPSDNGRVVQVVAIELGAAYLDIDGDGLMDDSDALLGTTLAEREKLAQLYSAGAQLWRVPVRHFTPWDYNWPYGPPDGANWPDTLPPDFWDGATLDDCTSACGSVISVENQMLGESIPITGTPLSLHYESGRVEGDEAAKQINVQVSGATIPSPLERMRAEITIAGRKFTHEFSPAANVVVPVIWDLKDAYGRRKFGSVPVKVNIFYDYALRYVTAEEFERSWATLGALGSLWTIDRNTVNKFTLTQTHDTTLKMASPVRVGRWDATTQAFGGWTLSNHHAYDHSSHTLYLGNGSRRTSQGVGPVITTFAGGGEESEESGVAKELQLSSPVALASAPDGTLYVAGSGGMIHRISPSGAYQHIAGGGNHNPAEGAIPAREAHLEPGDLALGKDGSLYISEPTRRHVLRLSGGMIRVVAGNGTFEQPTVGEDVMATSTPIDVVGIDADTQGNLLLATGRRVRILRPDGRVQTYAGNGELAYGGQTDIGDGGPPRAARLLNATTVRVGPTGDVIISSPDTNNIRAARTNGKISTVTSGPDTTISSGGPVRRVAPMAIDTDGKLYVARDNRVYVIESDGSRTVIAGNGNNSAAIEEGTPAVSAPLGFIGDIAIAPGGALYVADRNNNRVYKVAPAMPGLGSGEMLMPSADGAEIYVFNADGKHLRTVDALLGTTTQTFAYDGGGRLLSITDADGNTVEIERTDERATAIIAPGGQRTTLTYGDGSYLASVTNPASETYQCTYYEDRAGLLATFKTPRNHTYTFTYDEFGRLLHDADPAGGGTTLAGTGIGPNRTVTKTTAEGRQHTYHIDVKKDGSMVQTTVDPAGLTVVSTTDAGNTVAESPVGSVSTIAEADPRFGMLVPVTAETTITDGSRTTSILRSRSVSLEESGNPLSPVQSIFESTSIGGRVYETSYDGATRTAVKVSPMGRTITTELDSSGRTISETVGGLAPVQYGYDGHGRLSSVSRGSRTVLFGYDTRHRLISATDPLQRTIEFQYDDADRAIRQIHPGNRTVDLDYDSNGNLASLIPPGKTAHAFAYTPVNQQLSQSPPSAGNGGTTTYDYNLDRQLASIDRPDSMGIALGYDTAGRLHTLTASRGVWTLGYDAGAGRLTSVAGPGGSLNTYTYDGSLATGVTWSGPVTGSMTWSYNGHGTLTSEQVQCPSATTVACNEVSYAFDDDLLLTSAGSLTLTRSSQNGLLTGTAIGMLSDDRTYTAFGELDLYTSRYDQAVQFEQELEHDAIGRITEKRETILGVTVTWTYAYDAAGRLADVTRDGVAYAHYDYDANGNRLARVTSNGTDSASCDAQDRLTQYGSTTYTYTPNGELETRTDSSGTTQYLYDELGSLLQVSLPDDRIIEYIHDAENRRAGKVVDGVVVSRLVYVDELRPAAEVDVDGNVIARYVYGSRSNVPDLVIRNDTTYRIISDHLGSPRLVVDVDTGDVVQRMDYDEFGNVLADTNPGFQPFGFAGGLYDAETGLVRFGARDYDSRSGRFVSKDPVGFDGGDANLYAYVMNDPVNLIDPMGTDWVDALEDVSNFAAGFGDTISLGATRWAREKISNELFGTGTGVDECSGWYTAGHYTGVAYDYVSMAVGMGAAKGAFTNGGKVLMKNANGGAVVRVMASRSGGQSLEILKVKDVLRLEAHPTARWMPRNFYRIHGHVDAFGKGVSKIHLPVQEGIAYGIHKGTSGNCGCQ